MGVVTGALTIGLMVGILSAVFGIGGGFLITPLLNIVLGVPMPIAVGTSSMQILGVASCSLYERRLTSKPSIKLAVVVFGGNFLGVRLGAALLHYLDELGTIVVDNHPLVIVDLVVLLIFIPLLLGITYWVYQETRRNLNSSARIGWFARLRIPPFTKFPELDYPELSIPVLAYFGLLMGFATGLLGIGGGVLLFPALIYLVGMHTHQASSTSLLMVWLTSILAVITHTLNGNVDVALAIPLLAGGTVGAFIGSRLAVKLSGRKLRRYFAYLLVASTLIITVKILYGVV